MADAPAALVTGASSGIGRAICRRLLTEGYRVIGAGRRDPSADFDATAFEHLPLDLADTAASAAAIETLVASHDIEILVHAAGYGRFGSIEQFSVAQIEQAITVNLTSALVICRSLVPAMRRRARGQLLFIGSESALQAGRKGAVYSAAKFGLRGFCQALRDDCARDGLRVSLVNPGMVRSPFFDHLDFAPGEAPENAITVDALADLVWQILQTPADIVIDEVNLTPRVKSIDFGAKDR